MKFQPIVRSKRPLKWLSHYCLRNGSRGHTRKKTIRWNSCQGSFFFPLLSITIFIPSLILLSPPSSFVNFNVLLLPHLSFSYVLWSYQPFLNTSFSPCRPTNVNYLRQDATSCTSPFCKRSDHRFPFEQDPETTSGRTSQSWRFYNQGSIWTVRHPSPLFDLALRFPLPFIRRAFTGGPVRNRPSRNGSGNNANLARAPKGPKKPKTAAELDQELDAFMGDADAVPTGDDATAPGTGDVDMAWTFFAFMFRPLPFYVRNV